MASLYRETYDSNKNNPRILQDCHGFKTIDDRHFYADRLLHDMAVETGFVSKPGEVRINRWRYARADFRLFTAIQKYTRSRVELPRPADFRRQLARSGGITIQEELFPLRIADSPAPKSRVLHTILIHGPVSRAFMSPDFRDNGFCCLAFPDNNYSEWAAILDIDRLIAECENQGMGSFEAGRAGSDDASPMWKERPDQME